MGMGNPWIRFLSSHGRNGKDVLSGKSPPEIRAIYDKTRDKRLGPHVYRWIFNEPKRGPSARWDTVIEEIVEKGILARDFDVRDVTPSRLTDVARAINAVMYDGRVNADNVAMKVAETCDEDQDAALSYEDESVSIELYTRVWERFRRALKCGRHVTVDGVRCHGMVDILVHLLAHELMHYVATRVCARTPSADGHDRTFLSLNNHFNAHPYGEYGYSTSKEEAN